MKLNLVMTADPQRFLRFTSSNNSGILNIPYAIDNSASLARYLEMHIPDDWLITLQDLYIQERAIINRRKQLITSYKYKVTTTFPPLIEQFKQEHPEHFI